VVAVIAAWAAHHFLPLLAMPTAAVVLGVVAANIRVLPATTHAGLAFAGKRLMRVGVVLLGLQVTVGQIVGLGWQTLLVTVTVVAATFFGTQWLGRAMGIPDRMSLLVATGFAICGASAVAAMAGMVRTDDQERDSRDSVTAIALVTLCGTLAIFVLPPIGHLLGLHGQAFGMWVGASVHDVGQVVAIASPAGAAVLTTAVAVKLVRVSMLAPIVTGTGLKLRHQVQEGKRPPIVPLFLAGFIVMVALASTHWVPSSVLGTAKNLQDITFAAALFGLGSAVRLGDIVRTGRKPLLLGLASWVIIATVAYAGVVLTH
jgi:uncharacterized integral membrane protein (TIGR00698 family)